MWPFPTAQHPPPQAAQSYQPPQPSQQYEPPSQLEQVLVNHDQRLQTIEAHWPQMARSVNALAQESERPGWVVHVSQLEHQLSELQSLVGVLICGIIAIAGLSVLSVGYLSYRIGGGNVPASSQ